ncbi:MAG: hypothetical protein IKT27_00095 [Clostridia bacterium]|nr:hypothetical protein [Clostridia bacterium]
MKKQLENLEILRDGIPENFEYMERMRENANDFDDLELNVTYEMDRNLNNKSIEVFLEKNKQNFYITIDLISREQDGVVYRKYILQDTSECFNENILLTLRSVLEFAPFLVSFNKITANDIRINNMTDLVNNQESYYVLKKNLRDVVVDAYDLAVAMIEVAEEEEQSQGLISDKKQLDGKAVKKREYTDHYTSCYNFSKDEIKDMMYN